MAESDKIKSRTTNPVDVFNTAREYRRLLVNNLYLLKIQSIRLWSLGEGGMI
jgi:hypothetical protein